ncbi:MAG TPA: PDZ domain-containing protein [Polyangiaceae bacterium]|jgi:C-terminal processing protease CtpA/Prc|nr:PDZ domain-containing protein [Polyangiaceae bacterium]
MPITAPSASNSARAKLAARAVHAFRALFVAFALVACEAPRGTIGAVIAQDDHSGRLFVRAVPKNLAADKAGVKRGDEILLIDGVDVRAMNRHQVHAALAGDVDAPVKLTLVRGEQILRVTVRRTEARRLLKPLPETEN